MGLSGDLETAIEEGATTIRVGTDIFGKRKKLNFLLLERSMLSFSYSAS